MNEITLQWTGRSCSQAAVGLLNLAYTNSADVLLDGTRVGEVFALHNGYYRPSVDGIRGDNCATVDTAKREVVRLHKTYRAPRP